MDSTASQEVKNLEIGNNEVEETLTNENRGKRKDSPTETGASSQPLKPQKILNPRSPAWEHFTRMKENRNKCVCNYCQKPFGCKTSSGTSNLGKHLLICKAHLAWKSGQQKKQSVISDEGSFQTAKVSEITFREASNEMLVLGEMPLAFIESVAWKHFCNRMKLYQPHSRRTATRDIVEMYVGRKESLKDWFLSNKQRVSLTTDIWVAQATGASYMVVTAHFIDPSWRLKKLIIGFKYVSDHKGQTISTVLLDCLAEWGIEKLFCITVDNATANTSALQKFQRGFSLKAPDALVLDGECLHMRCAAHIINLVVRDGLAEIDDNVSAIRNAVSYVRSSTNRLNSFELRVDSGKMSRGSLPLDVKTRWNSTFLMLQRALKFRLAFEKMEAEDKLYNDHFLEVENGSRRVGPPLTNDWSAVQRLVKFLKIFYNSTLVVSASTSLNAHKCYGEIVTIQKNLVNLSNNFDPSLKSKAEEMLKKFSKYWDGLKNINKMLIVATVFDPSSKMQFARLCFDSLYGKDTLQGKEMMAGVEDLLGSLFKEYNARYSKAPATQSSQSSQATTSGGQDQALERMDLDDDDFEYERMDFKYKEMVEEDGVNDPRDELERYLVEPVEKPKYMVGCEFDVLSWWRHNSSRFPVLAEIARDVLAIQVSSVASESAFSTSGRIVEPYRSCLTHYMIEVLMCTEQWMKQDIKLGETKLVTNQQWLAEIEMQDKLEKEMTEKYG